MESLETSSNTYYVSITGLEVKGLIKTLRFWWHAIPSMSQAKTAEGIISADARAINGVQHTLTVWQNETYMRRFLYRGAHRRAIKAFPAIATGKTFGYETHQIPDWSEVHSLWQEHGKDYST